METKPKIILPFDPRRKKSSDWGEWVYEHRITLMVSLAVYLLFVITLVGWRISIDDSRYRGVIEVQFEDLEQLQREYQRQLEINRALMAVGGSVTNVVSNEAGELDDDIRDAKGTDARQLYADADAVQERLQMGGSTYYESRRVQNNRDRDNSNETSTERTGETTRKAGRVTVSYSLGNPVRSAVKMVTPSYQCEGGGEIVVNIAVNRNGDVVSASVDTASSSGDECMVSAARKAAYGSRFNATESAPERQRGTITYLFIPQ